MSRIRTIKPEFCSSEQVVTCSTTARLLFVEMWCFCDDNGNHPASVKRLKMECFPADPFTDDDMQRWVDELMQAGLLLLYESAETLYWHVTGWAKHQKIDRANPKFPRHDDDHSTIIRLHEYTSDRRALDEPSPPEGKGREGKGRESLPPDGGQGSLESDSPEQPAQPQKPDGPKYTQDYERVWKDYPRTNGSKKAGFKRWESMKLPRHELHVDDMLDAIGLQIAYKAACDRANIFCSEFPFLEKWLNEERWNNKPSSSDLPQQATQSSSFPELK